MRVFYLNRIKDISGMSGTGRVADGIEFEDGSCALRWNTPTASTEIWHNIKEVEKIHGHEGATKIVFLETPEKVEKSEIIRLSARDAEMFLKALENPPEPNDALKKALAAYQTKYFPKTTLNAFEKALDLAQDAIFVSFDGDSIGNAVARAQSKDDEAGTKDLSRRINAGGKLFEEVMRSMGGEIIEAGGDEAIAKLPNAAGIAPLPAIELFRKDYAKLVGATVTVGVGRKMSQATKARMLGKLTGKDKTVIYDSQTEPDLREKLASKGEQSEADKLREAGLDKAVIKSLLALLGND